MLEHPRRAAGIGEGGFVTSHHCHLWTLGQYSSQCCALKQGIHFIFCAEHHICKTPSALGLDFMVCQTHTLLSACSPVSKNYFAHRGETLSRNCFRCWETPDIKLRHLWIYYGKFWQVISSITEGFSSLSLSPFCAFLGHRVQLFSA